VVNIGTMLRPTNVFGQSCKYCSYEPLNADVVVRNNPTIHNVWYNSLPQKTDEDFWKHEWEKHGTCFGSQISYFQRTIALFNQYKFLCTPSNAYPSSPTKECRICIYNNFQSYSVMSPSQKQCPPQQFVPGIFGC